MAPRARPGRPPLLPVHRRPGPASAPTEHCTSPANRSAGRTGIPGPPCGCLHLGLGRPAVSVKGGQKQANAGRVRAKELRLKKLKSFAFFFFFLFFIVVASSSLPSSSPSSSSPPSSTPVDRLPSRAGWHLAQQRCVACPVCRCAAPSSPSLVRLFLAQFGAEGAIDDARPGPSDDARSAIEGKGKSTPPSSPSPQLPPSPLLSSDSAQSSIHGSPSIRMNTWTRAPCLAAGFLGEPTTRPSRGAPDPRPPERCILRFCSASLASWHPISRAVSRGCLSRCTSPVPPSPAVSHTRRRAHAQIPRLVAEDMASWPLVRRVCKLPPPCPSFQTLDLAPPCFGTSAGLRPMASSPDPRQTPLAHRSLVVAGRPALEDAIQVQQMQVPRYIFAPARRCLQGEVGTSSASPPVRVHASSVQ